MKAFLYNYRQSPRKVGLVAGLIKGKRVADAFTHLSSLPKRAAFPMQKLLASAVNNAKQAGVNEADLIVANVTVNKGLVMKRSMPRARGSASRINKRTSHIAITLAVKDGADTKKGKTPAKKEKAVKAPKEAKTVKKVTKSKTPKKATKEN